MSAPVRGPVRRSPAICACHRLSRTARRPASRVAAARRAGTARETRCSRRSVRRGAGPPSVSCPLPAQAVRFGPSRWEGSRRRPAASRATTRDRATHRRGAGGRPSARRRRAWRRPRLEGWRGRCEPCAHKRSRRITRGCDWSGHGQCTRTTAGMLARPRSSDRTRVYGVST